MLAIFITLFFLSYTSTPAYASTSASISTTPSPERIIISVGGEPTEGFDPLSGYGRYGSPLFQSTLLRRDADLKIVSDLATKWSLSPNRLVWTLKLRKDVHFSDGVALTANDVVYSYTIAKKWGGKVDLTILKEAKALAPDEVQFTLTRPQITFLDTLATLGIVPKHIHEKNPKAYARAPIGSGPYIFEEWQEGQHLKVKANPTYYNTEKRPHLTKLTFLFTDRDTAYTLAQSGQIHIVAIPPTMAKLTPPQMKLYALPSVDNRGITFPMVPENKDKATGQIIGNNVTADIAIRKAINYGINRNELVKGVLGGFASPAFGPADGLDWDNKDNHIIDNDQVKAQKILKEGGWQINPTTKDGILIKNGVRASFTLLYSTDDKSRQYLALAIKQQLLKMGIEANIEGMSWESMKNHYQHHPTIFGWGGHSPIEIEHLYHSSMIGQTFLNVGHYRNAKVDRYLEEAQNATSFEQSLPYWKKAQWDGTTGFSVLGDASWAWLVNQKHTYFIHRCLDIGRPQIEPHEHGWPLTSNIEEWKWSCAQ